MRRRAFTLVELIVVVIIVGILAALSFSYFSGLAEKGRGTEARAALGNAHTLAKVYWVEHGNLYGILLDDLGWPVGTGGATAPDNAHYFTYSISSYDYATGTIVFNAARCCGGGAMGKEPQGKAINDDRPNLTLTVNLKTGEVTWGGSGIY